LGAQRGRVPRTAQRGAAHFAFVFAVGSVLCRHVCAVGGQLGGFP
jgi:hypothetical protein